MNNALFEATRTPAIYKSAGKGKAVLIRQAMIDYMTGICDAIDAALAQIPQLLQKYKLSEFDNEILQRAILKDGFGAVQVAVYNRTVKSLEKSGLFPQLQKELANKNVDCIPLELRPELEAVAREIKECNRELMEPIDLETLWFRSGKLRVPPKYREGIEPRFILPVPEKDFKTVEKIREAAAILAELKKRGIQIEDGLRTPPAGGAPILCQGLISRMASGSSYTDAELFGLLQGIPLTH